MSKSKNPKIQSNFESSKRPKQIESPAQFKDIPISWQLSFLDEDGKWGLKVFKRHFRFSISDGLMSSLGDIHNDLYDAITELSGKTFDSVEDFLNQIHVKCKNNISIVDQKRIISALQENIFWTDIYPKLRHFESQTWKDLEKEQFGERGKTKHHSVSISKIIPEARKRLEELKIEDVDELFSIRFSGQQRIWGIRHFSFLKILWIDLKHEICPPSRN